WQILHEDLVVPSEGQEVVKLAAAPLKKVGETEETINLLVDTQGNLTGDSLEFQGLMRNYRTRPSLTNGIDLIVADTSTGLLMDSQLFNGQDPAHDNGNIDYRAGVIRFNPQGVYWRLPGGGGFTAQRDPIAGRHVRVYYRTDADWGVALQKPYANYSREL